MHCCDETRQGRGSTLYDLKLCALWVYGQHVSGMSSCVIYR